MELPPVYARNGIFGFTAHLDVGESPIIGISIFSDDGAKQLAASLGAAVLLDKANLYNELVPTITRMASPRP